MSGPERIGNVAVIVAALIFIAYQQGNWRAGSLAFKYARQDFNCIGFLALRYMTGGTGLAQIQFRLNIGFGQSHARRATVDHTSDSRTVRFAKSSHCKKRAKSIAGHSELAKTESLDSTSRRGTAWQQNPFHDKAHLQNSRCVSRAIDRPQPQPCHETHEKFRECAENTDRHRRIKYCGGQENFRNGETEHQQHHREQRRGDHE